MAGPVEFPGALGLLAAISWSLTESAGLPIGALALGAWLFGRDAGLLAGLATTWLVALIRKIATGSVPSLLTITAAAWPPPTALRPPAGQRAAYLPPSPPPDPV